MSSASVRHRGPVSAGVDRLAISDTIERIIAEHGPLLKVSRRWAELWYDPIERPDFWTDDFFRLAEGHANPTASTR